MKNILLFLTGIFALQGGAFATSYSTNFPANENPISEDGSWINGGVIGIDWCNVQSINGKASGTQVNASNSVYNDSTAILSGVWGNDQSAQATVIAGSSWQNAIEEVELRLRSGIRAHSNTGYEFDFRVYAPGGYVSIVRWNGPLNNFTSLNGANNNYHGIKQGDVLLATATGNILRAYVNGTLVAQVTDSTFPSGNPGLGFWLSGSGNNADFGLANFSATDGSSPTPVPTPTPNPTATPSPTPRHYHGWNNKWSQWIKDNPPVADQ